MGSEFDGAVALVTAAAGLGIGQAVARRLAVGGARVVLTDIHERRTREVAKAMAEDYPNGQIVGYPMDAGDRSAIDHVVDQVLERFGAVDILVNNAAVNILGSIFDYQPTDWDRVMDVNINGPWYLARRVFPGMRERGRGVVINIGSYAPDVGGAGLETPYAVSKGALNTLTRCLAHEGGPYGIRANTVSMGMVEGTKFVMDHPELRERPDTLGPLGSLPDKDEIAELVAFLASARAAHITGEIVNVSGGAYMRN
ncbi:SDR family NAD(P)-dependent oxidoreductase [uncultured Mycobacterium sp.]|uniref:SDR family NAD(P)-dependent oxidoreductase n=1 Tax=uncultured Mycobacterium sp. TaxID=171292 RepID=UPI0035CC1ECC